MKKHWQKIPRKIRFYIKIVSVWILIGFSTFVFGTFYPNQLVRERIVNETENVMVAEWNNFGFEKPSILYNSNKEFVAAVKRCIDYVNLHTLHVNRVDHNIITAMAVLETGWGKSRFALEANNLFGIRTWDPNVPQLKPLELPDADFGVKKYPTKCDSVIDMIKIINTHPAYDNFRLERIVQLTTGKINLDKQIEQLSRWSTNPEYTKLVKTKVKAIAEILAN